MASNGPSVISLRVRDAEGNPVAGARVFFTGGPGSFPEVAALTDGGGSAVLAAPTPGAYAIQIAADGFVPQTVSITVAENQQTAEDIVLQGA